MAVWNPFDTTTGAFNLIELTDAINRRLYRIGQVGSLNLFQSKGVATLKVAVEQMTEGNLGLITPVPRGAPAPQITKDKRNMVDLESVRIAAEDTIFADELQGVRVYGTEGQARAIEEARNESLDKITGRLDITDEHHQLGAIQGIVKNPAGSTILNCYTALGQSQASEINLEFDESTSGASYLAINKVKRDMLNALGADAFAVTGIRCFTDATGMDNLMRSKIFQETHLFDSHSEILRQGSLFAPIRFQGITWEEYRLGNSGLSGGSFIGTGKYIFFPEFASPDLGIYRRRMIPSDSLNDINEPGLNRYVKVGEDREYTSAPRWLKLMGESNPLYYVTRPECLQRGDDGVS